SRRRATDAEQREREAALLAEIAAHLLGGRDLESELEWVGGRTAEVLGVSLDRTRLEREALEAETLRRSDLVKTALLRAVSHDLRSPLTSITTAIGALRNDELVFTDT